jgi:ethanolamine-phosphate phospho-lyase
MTNEAIRIAKEVFGKSTTAKQLVSYEDVNFLLQEETGEKYILKLISDEGAYDFVQEQNQTLQVLNNGSSSHFPRVFENTQQELITTLQVDGKTYHARLLSFLEGQFLGDADQNPELLYNFGKFLGQMDRKIVNLDLPAVKARNIEWDLRYFPDTEKYLSHIKDSSKRNIPAYFQMRFKEQVVPLLPELRLGIIHNDPNDWNVLVNNNEVCGLIDFGDMVHSIIISELAIGLAYIAMNKENPLEAACHTVKGYHKEFPLQENELKVLYDIVAARLGTSVCMSAYTRKLNPENEYISVSEVPAWDLLEKWIAINPIKAENAFREVCGFKPLPKVNLELMTQNRFQHISKALSLSYNEPIKMEQAALQYMYDDRGNTYLDCVNNICHVGHCHPTVVKAGQSQMAKMNTNTRYLYDQLNDYAAQLCATLPNGLNKVFFVNSGSAASDLAIRLAKAHTNGTDVMIVDHSYHGNTSAIIDISSYKFEGKGGNGQANHIHQAPIPDGYRGPYKSSDSDAGLKYAQEAGKLFEKAKTNNRQIAAFICESIIGCGGQVVPPKGYFENVYSIARKNGAVCIADEVQTGFGRVGHYFWAFELQNVVPDIVIMGKPMGNGHPIAAVVTTNKIAASFENGMEFFSSFGGNPVSCAIGKAVLDVIETEQLQQHALEVGNYLIDELNSLKDEIDLVGNIRGAGFFLGIELVKDHHTLEPAIAEAKSIINFLKSKHIMLSTDGPFNNVLKFKPPMCFSKANAQHLITELKHAFRQL